MQSPPAHPIRTHPIQSEPVQTGLPGPDESRARESQAARIETHRTAYAAHIVARAGMDPGHGMGSRIAAALAYLPRERFVEPPPWSIVSPVGRALSISDDPAVLYQDMLVPLGAGCGLNNGQPSLHALCLDALAPQEGDHAVHVGAGTGYYTAVLAMLVGETGRVDGYEIEPDLARRAEQNLAGFPQVGVHSRSGAEAPLPDCDVLYVSAAADEPLAVWLDALLPRGRLLFPLEPLAGAGRMLLVTRQADGAWSARFLCGVQFVACEGGRSAQASRALRVALSRDDWSQVRSLHRNDEPDGSCWCAGQGWWLSTR
ncbi:MAG: protein-L-isoaspartate(D-aspartate) O-methyltransferase [Terracidiphilus sp.]|nr:protein-L-isoaspartate(D-aspartate) O-methyltransferase [Terracidiphilus sp.]